MRKKSAKNSARPNSTLSAPKYNDEKRIDDAKQYCLKLLGIRARTRQELSARLSEKKYAADIAEAALRDLVAAGLVDDKNFAHHWIERRLAENYGKTRIAFELGQKGVPEAVITQELKIALNNYNENDIVTEEAEKFIKIYRNLKPDALIRRLYGYLIRKGFSPDIVQNTVTHHDNKRNS